jgi:hypothetical protein
MAQVQVMRGRGICLSFEFDNKTKPLVYFLGLDVANG